ncbi:MAG: CDP-diacylglycerol--glycerol-3-phosphate 3-phosphatidyltransferase [Christensenellaceae bacterium]|nr:CDP-diacylglycerol--glycerol-3-phosphate 3-phosphatidyltransferase [Christensenellaceae bacterium]
MNKLPNWLTVIRILFVPVFLVIYYLRELIPGWNYYASAVFIVACLTDILDGAIARKYNCVSNFGKLMDPMADKLLVLAALIVLLDWGKISTIVVIILLAREFIISAFRLIAAEKGVVIAAGWSGKIKTLTQDIGAALILLGNPLFSLINVPAGEIILYISVVFSIISCVEYILKNKKVISDL